MTHHNRNDHTGPGSDTGPGPRRGSRHDFGFRGSPEHGDRDHHRAHHHGRQPGRGGHGGAGFDGSGFGGTGFGGTGFGGTGFGRPGFRGAFEATAGAAFEARQRWNEDGPGSGRGRGRAGGERGGGGRGRSGHGPGGRSGHGPGGRFGRPGGWQQADLPSTDDVAAWFAGRLPDDWFVGPVSVSADREEITVIGELAAPTVTGDASADATSDTSDTSGAAGGGASGAAGAGRISRFREQTRDERMQIAEEAEQRYGRKVAWGVRIGDTEQLFTHLAVPVMTRLRQPERQVLDTLVDAGVARSRSEALSWCVRLVGEHTDEWLTGLRDAMAEVDKLRAEGPEL